MKKIKSSNAPGAIGPYSQAIVSNGLVFTSGQIGLNPKTNKFESRDFENEAIQVFENISAILKDSGSSMYRIVKINIFLTDLSNFDKLNDIMDDIFDNDKLPSRSTIEVSALPKGAAIEVDAIAEIIK
jgi:2-iminobutanoate/2-iminopropanoate deaminase